MSKLLALIAALLALGFAPTTSVATAQTVRFAGVIVEVHEASIVFHTDRGPAEVHVTPHTQLVRNGQPARLADFQRGDRARVVAEQTMHGLMGISIEAVSIIRLRGVIAGVGNTGILLHTDRGDLEIAVNEHTVIVRDGQPARLGDLREGDHAGVEALPDGQGGLLALAIHARSMMNNVVHLTGTIVELGADFLVLHTDRGNVRIGVTDRTEIIRNGVPAHFADLRVNDEARVDAQWHGMGHDRRLIALRIAARGH